MNLLSLGQPENIHWRTAIDKSLYRILSHQFIQPSGSPATEVMDFSLPQYCLPWLPAVAHYLRQNLLIFLHIPKYTDSNTAHHFKVKSWLTLVRIFNILCWVNCAGGILMFSFAFCRLFASGPEQLITLELHAKFQPPRAKSEAFLWTDLLTERPIKKLKVIKNKIEQSVWLLVIFQHLWMICCLAVSKVSQIKTMLIENYKQEWSEILCKQKWEHVVWWRRRGTQSSMSPFTWAELRGLSVHSWAVVSCLWWSKSDALIRFQRRVKSVTCVIWERKQKCTFCFTAHCITISDKGFSLKLLQNVLICFPCLVHVDLSTC